MNKKLAIISVAMFVLFGLACGGGATQEEPVATATVTAVPTPAVNTRDEQIADLVGGREHYYDKTMVYWDLGGRGASDLPQCLVTFTGAVLRDDGTIFRETRGLALIAGSHIAVPSGLIPELPDPNPVPPPPFLPIPEGSIEAEPVDLSGWSVVMLLGHDPEGAVGLAGPIEIPNLRITVFALDEQVQKDRLRAMRSASCKDLVLGDLSKLGPLDVLLGIGFDDRRQNFSEERSARIVGRVSEISQENHGIYFDGGIRYETDMGGLLFALHAGMPELVGIITGSNGPLGYETQNFATSIQDILDALEELKQADSSE